MKIIKKKSATIITFLCIIIVLCWYPIIRGNLGAFTAVINGEISKINSIFSPKKVQTQNFLYKGPLYHIFFHSLIVYPELAYASSDSELYQKYMITRDQFEKILPQLYTNNYILVDINTIYKINKDGTIERENIYIPKGKKPLILSIDDLSYYRSRQGNGFASKLVLDKNGNVATEIITPKGIDEITRDGDLVPIIDDFVDTHPDFSSNGSKGLIAITGFDGVLGYRTEGLSATSSSSIAAKKVIDKLKQTGWRFASHSYWHDSSFNDGTISLGSLQNDTELWNKEVRPLVGDTNIFVGPFGQIFSPNDPRQEYLVSQGFRMLCGVGMDLYLHYYNDRVIMDRADIDEYRIVNDPNLLKEYFDPTTLNYVSMR